MPSISKYEEALTYILIHVLCLDNRNENCLSRTANAYLHQWFRKLS
jgi:hypothetical protein